MMRLENWRARYEETIDAIRVSSTVGEWGQGDCLTGLVGPVVEALTGADPFARFRGRYKSARGALGIMRRSGFDNLADLVASELTPLEHPSQCWVGDIVAIPTDDDFAYALGVVNGERAFVFQTNGLATRDMSEAVHAFRVG